MYQIPRVHRAKWRGERGRSLTILCDACNTLTPVLAPFTRRIPSQTALALCAPSLDHGLISASAMTLIGVRNTFAYLLFVCPCSVTPVLLLHLAPKPPLLPGNLQGMVNIHTHHVDLGEPPRCFANAVMVVLAASCGVLFTLIYIPIHAHIYSPPTSFPYDFSALAYRTPLMDHGRVSTGGIVHMLVTNTSECIFLCARACAP